MGRTLTRDEIEEMSTEERLRLIDVLWDSLADHPESLPVPEEHHREIERRLEEYYRDPSDTEPWQKVREELFPTRR